jgi:hypothetical protein
MNFEQYLSHFESILHQSPEDAQGLYAQEGYMEYTKLNWSRMSRWLKTGVLQDFFVEKIKGIKETQNWIVITEPWCGDAAHIVPFIEMAARLNPLIHLSYELRDAEPFRIDRYLSNGSKSIPKLVIQNAAGADLAVWGPRPSACQDLYLRLKSEHVSMDVIKTEIQQWYNADKGHKIQEEIATLIPAS